MGHLEFEGFDPKTTKALEKKVFRAATSPPAVQHNEALAGTPARLLIVATIDFLEMALEDHPDGVTDMDMVDFAIDQLETVPSVTEDAWIYAGTEAFRATALGLLQALQALEG